MRGPVLVLFGLLFSTLLAACGTVATPPSTPTVQMATPAASPSVPTPEPTTEPTPSPTPVATPSPVGGSEAEGSIVSFMVDFIVEAEIGGTADYIRSSGQPWVEAPPRADIIIWVPPGEDRSSPMGYVRSDAPIRVWWYADGTLTEVDDKVRAIAEYRERYMKQPASDIWAYGYYEFAILSVSSSEQEAQVYVGASCGPLCGHGVVYTLRRDEGGQWDIDDSQGVWIS